MEVWLGIIERQALHRADVVSVPELNAKISAFVTGWNDCCHPLHMDRNRHREPEESQPLNDFIDRPLEPTVEFVCRHGVSGHLPSTQTRDGRSFLRLSTRVRTTGLVRPSGAGP